MPRGVCNNIVDDFERARSWDAGERRLTMAGGLRLAGVRTVLLLFPLAEVSSFGKTFFGVITPFSPAGLPDGAATDKGLLADIEASFLGVPVRPPGVAFESV